MSTHAYRASEELAAALRGVEADIQRFHREVQGPWDTAHPDTPSLWVRGMVDRRCVGFRDPGGDVPAGLSRSKARVELIPRSGKAGRPWRDALDLLNGGPSIGGVFGRFGMDPAILRVDHNRRYDPGILVTPDAVFLTWAVPYDPPSPYLTPVPLSVYYAALEQWEAERVGSVG